MRPAPYFGERVRHLAANPAQVKALALANASCPAGKSHMHVAIDPDTQWYTTART
jgi:hypothetical protein